MPGASLRLEENRISNEEFCYVLRRKEMFELKLERLKDAIEGKKIIQNIIGSSNLEKSGINRSCFDGVT